MVKHKLLIIIFLVMLVQIIYGSPIALELQNTTVVTDSTGILTDNSFDISDVGIKPILLKKKSPKYPVAAKEKQIEGKVVVLILIDESGNVIEATIKKSVPLLDESCIEAARFLKFKPGKHKGEFVKVRMSIPFRFNL